MSWGHSRCIGTGSGTPPDTHISFWLTMCSRQVRRCIPATLPCAPSPPPEYPSPPSPPSKARPPDPHHPPHLPSLSCLLGSHLGTKQAENVRNRCQQGNEGLEKEILGLKGDPGQIDSCPRAAVRACEFVGGIVYDLQLAVFDKETGIAVVAPGRKSLP